jgi:hypothetical protein
MYSGAQAMSPLSRVAQQPLAHSAALVHLSEQKPPAQKPAFARKLQQSPFTAQGSPVAKQLFEQISAGAQAEPLTSSWAQQPLTHSAPLAQASEQIPFTQKPAGVWLWNLQQSPFTPQLSPAFAHPLVPPLPPVPAEPEEPPDPALMQTWFSQIRPSRQSVSF